jgi:hypothetical protein
MDSHKYNELESVILSVLYFNLRDCSYFELLKPKIELISSQIAKDVREFVNKKINEEA